MTKPATKPKRKPGRPEIDESKRHNRAMSIVLSKEIYAKIESIAKIKRLPEATVVRLMIEDVIGV